jgi:hypothetical protein
MARFVSCKNKLKKNLFIRPVPCISSDDTYQGDDESVLFDINTTILCANVIVYMAIWILLVARKKTSETLIHLK